MFVNGTGPMIFACNAHAYNREFSLSGALSSRLNNDCSAMAGDLTWFFRFSIESVVRITGITAYMLIRSPRLGTCALSIIPIVAAVNKVCTSSGAKDAFMVCTNIHLTFLSLVNSGTGVG
jgi:ABC-type multidrug transport system fused ATPase/permease subunit